MLARLTTRACCKSWRAREFRDLTKARERRLRGTILRAGAKGMPRRRARAAIDTAPRPVPAFPNVGAPTASRSTRRNYRAPTGAPRVDQLHEGEPRAPRPESGDGAGDRAGDIAPSIIKGVDDQPLLARAYTLGGPEHGRVVGHRRVDSDQVDDGLLRTPGERIDRAPRQTHIRHIAKKNQNPRRASGAVTSK